MIRISEPALDRLEAIDPPPGRVLRLEPNGSRRLGLTFGEPRPDDQVVERAGHDVVHISHLLSSTFDGAVLSVRDSDDDARLVLLPPDGSPTPRGQAAPRQTLRR